jgi:hypothetical protein
MSEVRIAVGAVLHGLESLTVAMQLFPMIFSIAKNYLEPLSKGSHVSKHYGSQTVLPGFERNLLSRATVLLQTFKAAQSLIGVEYPFGRH